MNAGTGVGCNPEGTREASTRYFPVGKKGIKPGQGNPWKLELEQGIFLLEKCIDIVQRDIQTGWQAGGQWPVLRLVGYAGIQGDDPQLPAGGVDTILMVDTIRYVQELTEYARKLRAGLAPGGRLVIIDYRPKPWEERPWGPLPEQQIPRETLDTELAAAGLKPVKAHEFLPEQYFLIYGTE